MASVDLAGPGGLAPLHHVGYWVADIDAAAARWAATVGAGPFHVLRHVPFESFTYRGGPGHLDHSAAFARWGPMLIELDQLHSAEPPALVEALGAVPGTVGHVAWIVDSLAHERVRLAREGFSELTDARVGPVHAVWFDGGDLFGHPIEVHQDNPAIRSLYRLVTESAEGWDGSDPVREAPT